LQGGCVDVSAGLSCLATQRELALGSDEVQRSQALFNVQTLKEKLCRFVFDMSALMADFDVYSTGRLHNFLELIQ